MVAFFRSSIINSTGAMIIDLAAMLDVLLSTVSEVSEPCVSDTIAFIPSVRWFLLSLMLRHKHLKNLRKQVSRATGQNVIATGSIPEGMLAHMPTLVRC